MIEIDVNKYVIVFSLEQLLNIPPMDITKGLEEYEKHTKVKLSSDAQNEIKGALDGGGVAGRFNIGDATWEEVVEVIQKFSLDYANLNLTKEEIAELWNKICGKSGELEPYIIENINSLSEFLKNYHNITCLVPINTNPVHWEFIKGIEGMSNLVNNSQVIFSLSFERQTSNLSTMLSLDLYDFSRQLTQEIVVISLHRDIVNIGEVKNVNYNIKDGKISECILKVIEEYKKEQGILI